jgi:hypothetical protein
MPTITIPPLGPSLNWKTPGVDLIQIPAVREAMLGYAHGTVSFEDLGEISARHYRILEALHNLDAGNQNAVLRFLRLILNIQPDPTSAPRFFEALWRMSRSPAWKAKGIDDVLAYVAGSIHREQKRIARQQQLSEGEPADLQTIPAHDMLPDAAQTRAAQELLDHLRHLSTPRQRQIIDLLDQGHDRDEAAHVLKIKPDNLRRHLCDLNKTLKKNI